MDLLDACRGVLSPRKLSVLVSHLPPESATMTALRGAAPEEAAQVAADLDPAGTPWSQVEMLPASVIEVLRRLEWMYAASHTSGSTPRAPDPIPRPGVQVAKRKTLSVAQYRAMTGQEPPMRLVKGG